MPKNIIFGTSGLIGQSLREKVKKRKNYLYFSYKNKTYNQFNLNKSLKNFPYKKIDLCFFLASPRIKKINFKKKTFVNEYKWLNNVIKNLQINKIIYISSSSIYYKKNHIIGSTKLKCEKLIIKNKKKFQNYQIWRPFNLVGNKYNNSDHFHNLLFKKMFIEKKKKFVFSGNQNDLRGYSSVRDFVNTLVKYTKQRKSFIKDFGNQNLIKIRDIVNLFNKKNRQICGNNFEYTFKNKVANSNKIKKNKRNIYINNNSLNIFKHYLKNSLNEKKL